MVTGIIFASILYIFSLFGTFGSKQDKGLGYWTNCLFTKLDVLQLYNILPILSFYNLGTDINWCLTSCAILGLQYLIHSESLLGRTFQNMLFPDISWQWKSSRSILKLQDSFHLRLNITLIIRILVVYVLAVYMYLSYMIKLLQSEIVALKNINKWLYSHLKHYSEDTHDQETQTCIWSCTLGKGKKPTQWCPPKYSCPF